jgi:hypothetical protein
MGCYNLESHLRDKDKALLSSLRCSSEFDQELLRHLILLRTTEEATTVKAHELEELHGVKD